MEKRSRGELDKDGLVEVNQQLPDIAEQKDIATNLEPDLIACKFIPDSQIPQAAVPILEAVITLDEARYALYEALAHRYWHLHLSNPPNKLDADLFSRFYLDDASLRLYAAAEHCATAILAILDVDKTIFCKYKKSGSSKAKAVGEFLRSNYPDHPITMSITKLLEAKGWSDCINYRNRWVHDQPPLIEGIGSAFKRGNPWKETEKGRRVLTIGTGDQLEYTIEDLIGVVQPALTNFAALMKDIIDFYIQLLEDKGLTRTENGWHFSLFR